MKLRLLILKLNIQPTTKLEVFWLKTHLIIILIIKKLLLTMDQGTAIHSILCICLIPITLTLVKCVTIMHQCIIITMVYLLHTLMPITIQDKFVAVVIFVQDIMHIMKMYQMSISIFINNSQRLSIMVTTKPWRWVGLSLSHNYLENT
jgi:hypothetical protein